MATETNDLPNLFEKYLNKNSIFTNRKFIQTTYIPEKLFHRDEQINTIAGVLAPCLKQEKPSNLFVYGKTGTGKTATLLHITDNLQKIATQRNIPLKVCYINCKLKRVADTEYRLLAQLVKDMGKEVPSTGLPTDDIYTFFFKLLEQQQGLVLLVLDEIDQLVKKAGDEILYNLTRMNSELKHAQISLIGISNDPRFAEQIDPRVKSSLGEEEIMFPPYNALQIQTILRERAAVAMKPDGIGEGVIEKCSAYAAREHGDARRALELLRVAAELAERANASQVTIAHLDLAEKKQEKDKMTELITTQPKQYQVVLLAIFQLGIKESENIFTGEAYELYKTLCPSSGLRPITQRRFSDIMNELDMLGLINAKVISKGRHGRTREIALATTKSLTENLEILLKESLGV
ncbi:ORC1-type DNA replication protein [Candidatus Woesearchaeota archaeon]|nr:ORC1-type DNA replication protein [Candidatus Woesearchaeota archaeon]